MGRKIRIDPYLAASVLVLAVFFGYMLYLRTEGGAKRPAAPKAARHEKKSARPMPVTRARVAIIIDDMGSDMKALGKAAEIGAPMDIAVLPGLAHSKETAVRARDAGLEVLLHLPMQPKGESLRGLGGGALLSGMDRPEISDTIARDLGTVPGAVGVNNHMGSGLTEDMETMRAVMAVLRGRGLFFVDSRTTSGSVAALAAKEKGVRFAARDVFLDDLDDEVEIKRQFDRMVGLAVKHGAAVAIGHPRAATLEVLKREVPGLRRRGIEVVKLSKLVR